MSNKREIAKIAREINSIKAELNKESASGNVFSEMILALFPGLKVDYLETRQDFLLVTFKDSMGLRSVSAQVTMGFDQGTLLVQACGQKETGFNCSEIVLNLHKETTSSASKKISMFLKNL